MKFRVVSCVFLAGFAAVSLLPAAGVEVGGRVLVPGDAPLPGAEVALLPAVDSLDRVTSTLEAEIAEPAVALATTDESGRFRLVAPHAGLWRVRVAVPGFAPLESELTPLIDPVELEPARLVPDAGLNVRVLSGGSPVVGATVVARSERPRFGRFGTTWSIPVRAGRTNAEGTLRIPRGERESTSLAVSAPGFAVFEKRGILGTAARVTLEKGVATAIEVRGDDAEPVPSVLVAAGTLAVPVGRTGDDGKLVVTAKRAQPLEVALVAEDGRKLETRVRAADVDAPDRPRALTLPARIAVEGKVLDVETRRPVVGGIVWDAETPARAAVTDGDGCFSLAGPAGSRIDLASGAPGYLPGNAVAIQLVADGRPGPSLGLRPAAAIEGRVADGDGAPVEGAEMLVEVKRQPGSFRIEIGGPSHLPRARTSEDGSFRISALDPDKSYVLKAAAEGFAAAEKNVGELEPYRTRSGVNLNLDRGLTIRGNVVDGERHAIREATLQLERARSRSGMGMMEIMEGGPAGPASESISGDDGRFELTGVPAGRFELLVRRPGFAKTTVPGIELDAKSESLDLGDIVLEPGERVQGLVLDSNGSPVEGARVYVSEAGPMQFSFGMPGGGPEEPDADAVTDPTGWFTVEDLARERRYSFLVRRSGFVEANEKGIEVPRPEPVEIHLQPSSQVSGQVLDAEGQGIAGAQVDLSRSRTIEMGGAVMKTIMLANETTDIEGRFIFRDQEPGEISLKAVASGYQEAKRDGLEIPEGEDLTGIELPLPAGAVVVGQVYAPDGRPVTEARVTTVGDGSAMMMMMGGSATDAEGRFRLEGLAAGKASVEANHGSYPRVVRDLELSEGLNELDLHFEGGAEVSGRVADDAGNPVPDANVSLVASGRYFGGPEARTKSDGSFSIPGVQDGDYRLWVEAERYAAVAGETRVNVAGEPVAGLEVLLGRGTTVVGRVTGLAPERFVDVGVRAQGPGVRGFEQSSVDREGNFRVEHLVPGTYELVATLAESGRQAKERVTVEQGTEELRVDLVFGTGLTLSGRALQNDAPISGAALFVEGVDVDSTAWTQTGHEGDFEVDGLEPGSYRVNLRDWQTGLSYQETVELTASRSIELEVPTARIRGRATDLADRQPLAGVTVALVSTDPAQQGFLPMHSTTTDLEGRFELSNVADGSWRLRAEKKGYSAQTREVTVQFGKEIDDVDVPMDPTEGMTIEARLPSGSTPDAVRLAVLDPSGTALVSGNYATGENGRVRLSSVPPGTWELIVSAPGAAVSTTRATAPGNTVPVALQPACSLKVSVPELRESGGVATVSLRDSEGRPFRNLSWNGQPRSEWRITGGEIQFGSLPPGSWSVSVATHDGRTWQGQSVTSGSEVAQVSLE